MRIILAFLALLLAIPSLAQDTSSKPAQSEGDQNALDAASLEPIFDDYFAKEGPVSYTGAAVAVVQNGQILFAKGYGFANADRNAPVNPQSTPFAIGSLTKTWVGTLLAQLTAEGVVALDDPVNQHLTRATIPNNKGEAITLRQLATHQAGFADAHQPFMRPGQATPGTTGDYILSVTPTYIRPVNSGANYSNFGIALLGWALEDATGKSLNTLLAERIFTPANMQGARIIEGPQDRGDTAQGDMFYPNGGIRGIPTEWANNHTNKAAGGAVASAADIARYMIGLMDGTLLTEEARQIAFSRQGETHPLLQGFGAAFMLNDWNGEVLAEHGGRTIGTTTYMSLIPGQNIGIFVSVTGEGGTILPLPELLGKAPPPAPSEDAKLPLSFASLSAIRALGLEALLGRYQPPVGVDAIEIDLTPYAGEYISERRPTRSPLAAFRRLFLGGAPLKVEPSGDGGLRFGFYGVFDPVAPDIFYKRDAREGNGASGWSDMLVFRRGDDGQIADAATTYTDALFAKQSAIADLPWLLLIIGAFAFLLTGLLALVWPKGTRGRWAAVLTPVGLIALPIMFFRAWPYSEAEALSFVMLTEGDLWLFQSLGTVIALAVSWVAINALRPVTAEGWRAGFAFWHRRALAPFAIALIIGMISYAITF